MKESIYWNEEKPACSLSHAMWRNGKHVEEALLVLKSNIQNVCRADLHLMSPWIQCSQHETRW